MEWYPILCLPPLFAAGTSQFDTLDDTFVNFADHWAFASPVRKVHDNLTVTGLAIAVAFVLDTPKPSVSPVTITTAPQTP